MYGKFCPNNGGQYNSRDLPQNLYVESFCMIGINFLGILLFLAKATMIELLIECLRYLLYPFWRNPWEGKMSPKIPQNIAFWLIHGIESLIVITLLYSEYNVFLISIFTFCIIFLIHFFTGFHKE